ncbi:MAG: DUF2189 domain-containing protein [Gammaproteobacteria bacterium]
MSDQPTEPEESKPLPFSAKVNRVPPDAPLRWLRRGLQDMKQAPNISLTYGFVLTLVSVMLAYVTWQFGTMGLYLGMATGFVLIGPVLSMGLYSFSCQLEEGRDPVLGYCVRESRRNIKDILVFAFILLIVFMLWARSASAVHIFFPMKADYNTEDLMLFLGIGSAIGAFFSAIVFTASAFSLPMLMDRDTDAITAVITSINAVLRNKKTMLVWGSLIVGFVLIGFATLLVGFVFILPLIGHATWHAYRETVDASLWPRAVSFGS